MKGISKTLDDELRPPSAAAPLSAEEQMSEQMIKKKIQGAITEAKRASLRSRQIVKDNLRIRQLETQRQLDEHALEQAQFHHTLTEHM